MVDVLINGRINVLINGMVDVLTDRLHMLVDRLMDRCQVEDGLEMGGMSHVMVRWRHLVGMMMHWNFMVVMLVDGSRVNVLFDNLRHVDLHVDSIKNRN